MASTESSSATIAAYIIAEQIVATQARAQGSPVRDTFKRRYRDRPDLFWQECFAWGPGEGPTEYQLGIARSLVTHKKVAVRGPHGLGKTATQAAIVLWFALTRDGEDWKIPTTASVWRQLERYLWPEIHKWAKRLKWEIIGRSPLDHRSELLQTILRLSTGEAFAVASDDPAAIEGAHADQLLYLFDESKAVKAATFDAAEGAFSGGGVNTATEAYALAMSTPGEPTGRFYEIHARRSGLEDWHAIHVTLEQAIEAGRINREWAERRRVQWGENSPMYMNRVLGEFATSASDRVIPLSWITAAVDRWHERGGEGPEGWVTLGVDVGRGGDQTVIAVRRENVITELRRANNADTMETAGVVAGILNAQPGEARVDVIGIGAGVVDRLREDGYNVSAFNASMRTDYLDRSGELGFTNVRSAAWWNLREMLDPSSGEDIALPDDDWLIGDLAAPGYRQMSGGRVQVEGKDDIRKRLGRSTDNGDAVVQAFWEGEYEFTPVATGLMRGVRSRR